MCTHILAFGPNQRASPAEARLACQAKADTGLGERGMMEVAGAEGYQKVSGFL